jgi:CHAD domain-containing protein
VVDRFVELEVELLRGDEARLGMLGETLGADPALDDVRGSKLEAALAAIRIHDGAAASADGTGDGLTEPSASDRPAGEDDPTAAAPTGVPAESPAPAESRARARAAAAEGTLPASSSRGATPPPSPAGEPEPRLAVGRTPGVTADDHVAEAGRKVLRFHLARMIAREAGTRSGEDPEDLHSMRVATRRMRAAWRVFGDGFRPERTKRYRNRLREVAGRLGAVRDLDVLLEAAGAYRSDLPKAEQKALEPLLAAWRRYREDARGLLLHALDSPGYARFVEDFRVFVQTEGAAVLPVVPTQPHRIRDTTPSRIWSAYQQVRAYEPVLRWADVETLHDLRIAAKWLRYTLEFVREALGPEAAGLIARVTALQDHLGWLHDADVAAAMARTFLVEHAGSLSATESAAIGRYLVSREREVARLRRTVGAPWRGVAGLGFRRALARTVAGL